MTLAHLDPVSIAFFRCALPLPVLAALAAFEQRREGPRPKAARGHAVIAGLFFAANLVLWNHSIADVGAGIGTVLGNLQVLFIVALAWAFLRERPDRRFLLTLPVVLLGIALLSGSGGGTARHPVAGVAYGLATSAAYACFLLILRQTAGGARHVAGQLADATGGAAAGALLYGLVFGGLQLAIPLASLGWLLVLAVTSGIVGWLLITSSLPHVPAGVSAVLLLLEPACSLVLAAVILDQLPSPTQVGGAVLVCGGAVLVTRSKVRSGGRNRRAPSRCADPPTAVRPAWHPQRALSRNSSRAGRIRIARKPTSLVPPPQRTAESDSGNCA